MKRKIELNHGGASELGHGLIRGRDRGMRVVTSTVLGAVTTALALFAILETTEVGAVAEPARSDAPQSVAVGTLPGDPPPRPTPLAWHCEPYATHVVDPTMALRGEANEVTATITVNGACRRGVHAGHVVLVLTGIAESEGSSSRRLLDGLLYAVQSIFEGDRPSQRAGIVVGEGDAVHTVLPITEDRADVIRSVRRWYLRGAADSERAAWTAQEARIALDRAADRLGPDDHPERESIREVVFFVGDLGGAERCPALVKEAERLKKAGVLVMTGCTGRNCVTRCHQKVATSLRYVYTDTWWGGMRDVFERARVDFGPAGNLVRRIDVETEIGPDFAYVEDSADPPLSQQNGGRLFWTVDPALHLWSGSNHTFSYRLRSKRDSAGNTPIATRTTVSVWSKTDYPNYVVHRSVPSPYLLILDPRSWPDLGWSRSIRN